MVRFEASRGAGVRSSGVAHWSGTLDALAVDFRKDAARYAPGDDTAPTFCPSTFTGRRRLTDLIAVHALVFDVDGKRDVLPSADFRSRLGPVAALYHPTKSDTPTTPRYRVIVPLAGPVSALDAELLWDALHKRTGGVADPASRSPVQHYRTPRHGACVEVWQGEVFDPVGGWDTPDGARLDLATLRFYAQLGVHARQAVPWDSLDDAARAAATPDAVRHLDDAVEAARTHENRSTGAFVAGCRIGAVAAAMPHLDVTPWIAQAVEVYVRRASRPHADDEREGRRQVDNGRKAGERRPVELYGAVRAVEGVPLDDARQRLAEVLDDAIKAGGVHALCVTPGVGKSRAAKRAIAARPGLRAIYAVPTGKLAREVTRDLRALGVTAEHVVGRAKENCERYAEWSAVHRVDPAHARKFCGDCDRNESCPFIRSRKASEAAPVRVMTHERLRLELDDAVDRGEVRWDWHGIVEALELDKAGPRPGVRYAVEATPTARGTDVTVRVDSGGHYPPAIDLDRNGKHSADKAVLFKSTGATLTLEGQRLVKVWAAEEVLGCDVDELDSRLRRPLYDVIVVDESPEGATLPVVSIGVPHFRQLVEAGDLAVEGPLDATSAVEALERAHRAVTSADLRGVASRATIAVELAHALHGVTFRATGSTHVAEAAAHRVCPLDLPVVDAGEAARAPDYAGPAAFAASSALGFVGVTVHPESGALEVPFHRPLRIGADVARTVLYLDGTTSKVDANAWIDPGPGRAIAFHRIDAQLDPGTVVQRIDCEFTPQTVKGDRPGLLSRWRTANESPAFIGGTDSTPLHVTRKAWLNERHELHPHVRAWRGDRIHLAGADARGSNKHEKVTHVVCDTMRVPARTIAARAALYVSRGMKAGDAWAAAQRQLEDAHILQAVHRARPVLHPVCVTYASHRTIAGLEPSRVFTCAELDAMAWRERGEVPIHVSGVAAVVRDAFVQSGRVLALDGGIDAIAHKLAEIVREHRSQLDCWGRPPQTLIDTKAQCADGPSNADGDGLFARLRGFWRNCNESGASLAELCGLAHAAVQGVARAGGVRLDVIGSAEALDGPAIDDVVQPVAIERGWTRYHVNGTTMRVGESSPLDDALRTVAAAGELDDVATMPRMTFYEVIARGAGVGQSTLRGWIARAGGYDAVHLDAVALVSAYKAQRAAVVATRSRAPATAAPRAARALRPPVPVPVRRTFAPVGVWDTPSLVMRC